MGGEMVGKVLQALAWGFIGIFACGFLLGVALADRDAFWLVE